MTDLRKAAEQAAIDLEELIHWHGIRDSNDKLMPAHNQTPEIKSVIESLDALRQALAQPEQEPVAWMYVNDDGECEQIEYGEPFDDPSVTPLYTAPPKREWIDLTEEEAFACRGLYFFDTYKNINDKLKEKNT